MVQVTDENRKPVAGAAVVFLLPNQGAGGTFANGARSLTTLTDSQWERGGAGPAGKPVVGAVSGQRDGVASGPDGIDVDQHDERGVDGRGGGRDFVEVAADPGSGGGAAAGIAVAATGGAEAEDTAEAIDDSDAGRADGGSTAMREVILGLVAAGTLTAQSVGGPVMGYVVDGAARMRPLYGMPAAGHVGAAVREGVRDSWGTLALLADGTAMRGDEVLEGRWASLQPGAFLDATGREALVVGRERGAVAPGIPGASGGGAGVGKRRAGDGAIGR